jgi:Fe-S cluster assembly protein SufD
VAPSFVEDRRRAALEVYESQEVPTWRRSGFWTTSLRGLDLDALEPKRYEPGLPQLDLGDDTHSALIVQRGANVVHTDIDDDQIVVMPLEQAVEEHADLVEEHFGRRLPIDEGKFAAGTAAFWTGGVFIHVPKNVRVEVPLRAYRWIGDAGTAVFGRTLVVAEAGSQVSVVDELASGDFGRTALHVGAAEIFADEGATVVYTSAQRFGRGVVHLQTDRLVAGRDARITMLYSTLGADFARVDAQCAMRAPGSHVDVLGIYIGQGDQHFDHETLQDHSAPHASSNLLFKGAIDDEARSVFRGLIRVHPNAQRTDAYQTNRNLVLSSKARADSLPNLEIQADDVRCSHAATVGQLDEEEIFYLLSRGIPKGEAVRLVVFGFFAEVLDQLPLEGVRGELLRAVERKLARRG